MSISDLIGTPFAQMRCWDLVREVYRREGKMLPDYTALLADGRPAAGAYLEEIKKPEKGCICVYSLHGGLVDHVAVYLGGNRIIHATEGVGVCIEPYSRYLCRLKYMYRYRRET